uniref:Tubulin-specific chaperone A n=1 Tax=Rhabditophanes sp. KR3021 TaxID=114890 RepID=A0AC35TVW1_9BILA
MSSTDCVKAAKKNMSSVHASLIQLIESYEKPNVSDTTAKLKALEGAMDELKASILNIPDIDSNSKYQREKLEDQRRQVREKKAIVSGLYEFKRTLEEDVKVEPIVEDPQEATIVIDKEKKEDLKKIFKALQERNQKLLGTSEQFIGET